MTEKMLMTIEAALHRVLHDALKKADAMYPNRKVVDIEHAKHLECVQVIMAWFEKEFGALRKMRLGPRPGSRPVQHRSTKEETSDDEWDLLLMFFGSPGAAWMMSVGLTALPYDIRLMLTQMTYVLELALAGEMQKCALNLHDLADLMSVNSDGRGVLKKGMNPHPDLDKDRERIEKECKAMADRFKKMMQPVGPAPSTKSLGVSRKV